MRQMWPQITTLVASDAFLIAWFPWVQAFVGTGFGAYKYIAMANLLAHVVLRLDPEGVLGGGGGGIYNGPVRSISTASISVSYGGATAATGSVTGVDAELLTTVAGSAFIALRNTRAAIMTPRVVY